MTQDALQALQRELDLKRQELNLIVVIDRIRDTVGEPMAMLSAIISLLVNELHIELSLLWLSDPQTERLSLKTIDDRRQKFDELIVLTNRELADKALKLNHATVWTVDQLPLANYAHPLPADLQVVALPIMLKHTERLGVVLLARTEAAFLPEEVRLLQTAESQIDSVIIQACAYSELQRRVNKLETLHRIDHIRQQGLTFDEMLQAILHEVQSSLNAEIGFVMLYDRAGQTLEMRATTPDDLRPLTSESEVVRQIASESLEQNKLLCRNDPNGVVSAVMCLPLTLNGRIIGVLGAVNQYDPHGFDQQAQQLLSAIGNQIDTAIFESIELRHLRQVFGRAVEPRVMQRLLATADLEFLQGERLILTVLYASLGGSTQLVQRTEPKELVDYINHSLGQMTEIIFAHGGTLDQCRGDQVRAIFGAPLPQADHALRAVRAGLAIQTAHRALLKDWQSHGRQAAPLGVGIATGKLIAGEMGSPWQTDYTVIGQAANLAAKIGAVAEASQILISQATYEFVRQQVEARSVDGLYLEDIAPGMTIYAVTGLLD